MPSKKSAAQKNTNPFISILIATVLFGPIVTLAVLMYNADSITLPEVIRSIGRQPGASLGLFFAMVGSIPLFWGVCALIASLFAKSDMRKGIRFLGYCFIGTAIGLVSVGILTGFIAYCLIKLVPGMEWLWLMVAMAVGFYLMIKAGPFFTKLLFVKGATGRFVIDNSYLFGGTNMPRKKVRQKRGIK